MTVFSCEKKAEEGATNNETTEIVGDQNFGAEIDEDGAVHVSELKAALEQNGGDKLEIKVKGTIEDVCQKKGCWMNVDMDEENSVFVKFKDYEFFVPKDAAGSEVVMDGVAYLDTTTVEELKHYAQDAGEPDSVINAITNPEIGYGFMANGVIIKSNE